MVVGPALGGLLINWGYSGALYVSAAFSLFNLLACVAFVPESRWLKQTVSIIERGSQRSQGKANPKLPKTLLVNFLAYFLFNLAAASLQTVTGYFLMDTYYDGDADKAGMIYGYTFMAAGILQFVMAVIGFSFVRARLGDFNTLCVGIVFRTIGFMLMPNMHNAWGFLVAIMIQYVGSSLIGPILFSNLANLCPSELQGRAMGVNASFGAGARILGPIVFGYVYDNISRSFCFYACGLAGAVGGLMILLQVQRHARRSMAATPADSAKGALKASDLSSDLQVAYDEDVEK